MNAYSDTKSERFRITPECMFRPDKIAIVDIDDVLAEFPPVFIEYVQKETGRRLDWSESQYGLEDAVIKDYGHGLLDDFYTSHEMMKLPVIPGALDFFKVLKGLGFYTVALTGRPGGTFRQVCADTIHWLAIHGFQFDEVCFSRQKGSFVKEHFYTPSGRKPEYIIGVEDNSKNAIELAGICDLVYFRNKPKAPPAEGWNIFSFWNFKDAQNVLVDTEVNRHYDTVR
jgi:hypothetical protein